MPTLFTTADAVVQSQIGINGKHTISIRSGKVGELTPKIVEIKSGANMIDIACKPKAGKNAATEEDE